MDLFSLFMQFLSIEFKAYAITLGFCRSIHNLRQYSTYMHTSTKYYKGGHKPHLQKKIFFLISKVGRIKILVHLIVSLHISRLILYRYLAHFHFKV